MTLKSWTTFNFVAAALLIFFHGYAFGSSTNPSDYPQQFTVVSTTVVPGSGVTMIMSSQGHMFAVDEACLLHCWDLTPQRAYPGKIKGHNQRIELLNTEHNPPKAMILIIKQIYSSGETR